MFALALQSLKGGFENKLRFLAAFGLNFLLFGPPGGVLLQETFLQVLRRQMVKLQFKFSRFMEWNEMKFILLISSYSMQ